MMNRILSVYVALSAVLYLARALQEHPIEEVADLNAVTVRTKRLTCDDAYVTSESLARAQQTVDCGAVDKCVVESAGDRCYSNVVVDATSASQLFVTCAATACFYNTSFNLPTNGQAEFSMVSGGSDAFAKTRIIGGSHSHITVDCTNGDIDPNVTASDAEFAWSGKFGCPFTQIDAQNANSLHVIIGDGNSVFGGYDAAQNSFIRCPTRASNGPDDTPCSIDVSGGGTLQEVHIFARYGLPETLVVDRGVTALVGQWGTGARIRCTGAWWDTEPFDARTHPCAPIDCGASLNRTYDGVEHIYFAVDVPADGGVTLTAPLSWRVTHPGSTSYITSYSGAVTVAGLQAGTHYFDLSFISAPPKDSAYSIGTQCFTATPTSAPTQQPTSAPTHAPIACGETVDDSYDGQPVLFAVHAWGDGNMNLKAAHAFNVVSNDANPTLIFFSSMSGAEHSVALTDLQPDTLYHFSLTFSNLTSGVWYSIDTECFTGAPTTGMPTSAPTTPAPTTHAPTTPAPPTTPTPAATTTTPAPTTPAPTSHAPTTHAPTTSVPTTPAPITPAPTTTTPAPTTTTPAPTTPAPIMTTPAPTTPTPAPTTTTYAPTTPAPTAITPAPPTPVPTTSAPTTPTPAPTTTTPAPTTTTPAPTTTTPAPTTTTPAPTTTTPAPTTPAPTLPPSVSPCDTLFPDHQLTHISANPSSSSVYYLGNNIDSAAECQSHCLDLNYICDAENKYSYWSDPDGSFNGNDDSCTLTFENSESDARTTHILLTPDIAAAEYVIELTLRLEGADTSGLIFASSSSAENYAYVGIYPHLNILKVVTFVSGSGNTLLGSTSHSIAPETAYTLKVHKLADGHWRVYLNDVLQLSSSSAAEMIPPSSFPHNYAGVFSHNGRAKTNSLKVSFPHSAPESACSAYMFNTANSECFGYYGADYAALYDSLTGNSDFVSGILSPTCRPTNSPVVSPTNLPTTVPSKSPTNVPTTPSKSPSGIPTKTPTDDPTAVPSLRTRDPTVPPTALPSRNPTNPRNPSRDPTTQSTRVTIEATPAPEYGVEATIKLTALLTPDETVEIEDAFRDYALEQTANMTADCDEVVDVSSEVDDDKTVIRVSIETCDETEERELLVAFADTTLTYDVINAIITEAEVEVDIDEEDVEVEVESYDEIRLKAGVSAAEELLMNFAYLSTPTYAIIGLILILFLAAVIGQLDAVCCRKNDFFSIARVLSALLDQVNVIFDIWVAGLLYHYQIIDLSALHEMFTILFLLCAAFTVVPVFVSMLQLWYAKHKDWRHNTRVLGWLTFNSAKLYLLSFVTGSSFIAVKLANSNLFSLDLFSMNLSQSHYREFQRKKLYSVVLLKNAPQLVIQAVFLGELWPHASVIIALAMLFSVISILTTLTFFFSSSGSGSDSGSGGACDTAKLGEVEIDVVALFEQLSQYQNRVRRVQQELSILLGVDRGCIEVLRPTQIPNGLSVTIRLDAAQLSQTYAEYQALFRRAQHDGSLARMFKHAWDLHADPEIAGVRCSSVSKANNERLDAAPAPMARLDSVSAVSHSPRQVLSPSQVSQPQSFVFGQGLAQAQGHGHMPTGSELVIPGSVPMAGMRNYGHAAADSVLEGHEGAGGNLVMANDDDDDDELLSGLNGMEATLGGAVGTNGVALPTHTQQASMQQEGRSKFETRVAVNNRDGDGGANATTNTRGGGGGGVGNADLDLEVDEIANDVDSELALSGPKTAGADPDTALMADDEFEIVDDDDDDDDDDVIAVIGNTTKGNTCK